MNKGSFSQAFSTEIEPLSKKSIVLNLTWHEIASPTNAAEIEKVIIFEVAISKY